MNKEPPLKLPTPDLLIDSEIYKMLLDECEVHIYVKNIQGQYLYANKFLQALLDNKPLSEIIGKTDYELFDADVASNFIQEDREVMATGKELETINFASFEETGKTHVYKTVKKPVYNHNNEVIGTFGISTDITDLYNLKQKLTILATTDPLTKAFNRQSYDETIEKQLALYQKDNTPFSVILFDIDNFKQINDRYGHHTGDAVLKQLSALTQAKIRKNDFLFRMGGEEFLVLLPDTALHEAVEIAEQIRHATETSEKIIENQTTTISLGVTEVQPGDIEDSLYQRVDALLYKSKHTGKNKVSY